MVKRTFRNCVGLIPGLGSYSTLFQDRLGPTKLGIARIDLVVALRFKAVPSLCVHTSQWGYIYRDKRKFEFELWKSNTSKLLDNPEEMFPRYYMGSDVINIHHVLLCYHSLNIIIINIF